MKADTRETSKRNIHEARTFILLADSICAVSLIPRALSDEYCTGLYMRRRWTARTKSNESWSGWGHRI